MNKFCNVFLLILILLIGNHHFEARVLGPLSLNDVRLNVEEYKDLPEFNPDNLKYQTKKESSDIDDYLKYLETPSLNTLSSEDSQNYDPKELKCSLHKDKLLPKAPYKWTDSWYNDCIDEVANRWKNFRDRRRKKRVSRRQLYDNVSPLSFLDYTNSQMPFNEGQSQPSNSGIVPHQFADGFWEDGKKDLFVESYSALVEEPKRFERSVMKRRFEVPLKSQENTFEIPRDDPILEYSRVRRFLDQERAKKRKRMPGTLEAKEAAMSRILDPNLNLDGILEPHVRKRRGKMNIILLDRLGHTESARVKI